MVGIKDFEMPSCCNSCSHWSFNRDDEPLCDLTYEYIRQFNKRQDDCPLVETYTKADMVAMLTEIQLEIEEKEQYYQDKFLKVRNPVCATHMWGGKMYGCGECKEIIQQKIDALKAESEPQKSEE